MAVIDRSLSIHKSDHICKMDSSIKSLTITGFTSEDMKPRRGSAVGSRKKRQTVDQNGSGAGLGIETESDFLENAKRITLASTITKPDIPTAPIQSISPIQLKDIIPQEGGKIILKPPKQQRIKLQPKLSTHVLPTSQTRKARRISLTVANLTHRFTRAKKVRDDSDKKSINVIKNYLVQRGVIQEKSKAPDTMLRSMYSDFMLLKDQAL